MKIKNIKEISVSYEGLEISGTFIDEDNEEIFLKDYGIISEDITKYVLDLQQRIDKAIEYIHNHQLVFELSSKEQIQKWFDEFYRDILNILRGEE